MATKTPSSNSNYYVIVGLITALVVIATIFFGQSMVKSVLHNNRVNTALNKANNQLTSNLAAATTLVTAYNALGDTKQLISNALPSKSDYPGLTALLENAGASTSVTVRTVAPSAQSVTTVSSTGSPDSLGFTTTVTGTYAAVLSFLNALQQSVRPIQITSVQFSGTGSSITAQIVGTAYYQGSTELPFKTDTVK